MARRLPICYGTEPRHDPAGMEILQENDQVTVHSCLDCGSVTEVPVQAYA